MSEEIQRLCYTCRKDNIRTGKDCPTRSGCFTPDYKNWETIVEVDKDNPGWEILSFSYDKSDDHLLINLKNNAGHTILVDLSPDDIADMALNH